MNIESLLEMESYDGKIQNHAQCGQVRFFINRSRVCNYVSFNNAKIGEKFHIFRNRVVVLRNSHGIMQITP